MKKNLLLSVLLLVVGMGGSVAGQPSKEQLERIGRMQGAAVGKSLQGLPEAYDAALKAFSSKNVHDQWDLLEKLDKQWDYNSVLADLDSIDKYINWIKDRKDKNNQFFAANWNTIYDVITNTMEENTKALSATGFAEQSFISLGHVLKTHSPYYSNLNPDEDWAKLARELSRYDAASFSAETQKNVNQSPDDFKNNYNAVLKSVTKAKEALSKAEEQNYNTDQSDADKELIEQNKNLHGAKNALERACPKCAQKRSK